MLGRDAMAACYDDMKRRHENMTCYDDMLRDDMLHDRMRRRRVREDEEWRRATKNKNPHMQDVGNYQTILESPYSQRHQVLNSLEQQLFKCERRFIRYQQSDTSDSNRGSFARYDQEEDQSSLHLRRIFDNYRTDPGTNI